MSRLQQESRSTELEPENSPQISLAHMALQHKVWNLVSSIGMRKLREYLAPWSKTSFELRDMKHGVDFALFRKVQFVRHLSNVLEHPKRPKELEYQLMIGSMHHR